MAADSVSVPDSQSYLPLFTVGHSNLDFLQFVKLLQDRSVDLLIDVRSQPRSGRFPQFSQPGFDKMIEDAGIGYLFLGEELGGRRDNADRWSDPSGRCSAPGCRCRSSSRCEPSL